MLAEAPDYVREPTATEIRDRGPVFNNVPTELLDEARWVTEREGPFRLAEPYHRLESRALGYGGDLIGADASA